MISTIIGLFLFVGGITLYKTFALYEVKKEFNVLRGRVPTFSKGNGDIELAVLIDGEVSTEFPDKSSDAVVESIICDNGAIGRWDYQTWSINIGNLKKSKTACSISFKTDMIKKLKNLIGSESESQTVDEFLLNADDVDKLIVSTDGMNYIVENTLLKDLIKNSSNYTTTIAKKLLNSEAISEKEKYNAGLPCYLYKNGNNIFGGFSSKFINPDGRTDSTYVRDAGTYIEVLSSYPNTNNSVYSNTLIKTSGYSYLEMSSRHLARITNLSGINTIGFSDNQEINDFIIKKSETFTNTTGSTSYESTNLLLNIQNYQDRGYLKINVKNNGGTSTLLYNTVYTNIYTIALY